MSKKLRHYQEKGERESFSAIDKKWLDISTQIKMDKFSQLA